MLGFEVSNEKLMQLFIHRFTDRHLLKNPFEYLDYCNEHLYGKGKMGIVEQGRTSIQGKIIRLDKGQSAHGCGEDGEHQLWKLESAW